jgi:hypothetical protein
LSFRLQPGQFHSRRRGHPAPVLLGQRRRPPTDSERSLQPSG